MSQPGDITILLQRAEEGDRDAANQLFALVEQELRKIARKRRRNASADVDCSTTMLVHDAFMKLVGRNATTWNAGDRKKFYGFAAKKIQGLFFDAVRKQKTKRRGGDRQKMDIDIEILADPKNLGFEDADFHLALEESLEKLELFAPLDVRVFQLHVFVGAEYEDIADMLAISKPEAEQAFDAAWLWLKRELKKRFTVD